MLKSKMDEIMIKLKNKYGDDIPTDVAKEELKDLIECVTAQINFFPNLSMQNLAGTIGGAC